MRSQLAWLQNLLAQGKVESFADIPEYALSGPLTWLEFVIRGGEVWHEAQFGMKSTCRMALHAAPCCLGN